MEEKEGGKVIMNECPCDKIEPEWIGTKLQWEETITFFIFSSENGMTRKGVNGNIDCITEQWLWSDNERHKLLSNQIVHQSLAKTIIIFSIYILFYLQYVKMVQ